MKTENHSNGTPTLRPGGRACVQIRTATGKLLTLDHATSAMIREGAVVVAKECGITQHHAITRLINESVRSHLDLLNKPPFFIFSDPDCKGAFRLADDGRIFLSVPDEGGRALPIQIPLGAALRIISRKLADTTGMQDCEWTEELCTFFDRVEKAIGNGKGQL